MDTLVLVLRYGFLVALAVEAALIGRALFGMLREKARAASSDQSTVVSAAPAEE